MKFFYPLKKNLLISTIGTKIIKTPHQCIKRNDTYLGMDVKLNNRLR